VTRLAFSRQARLYLAVGSGAALGSLLRYAIGLTTVDAFGLPAEAATGLVNLAGSFVIGFFATISGPDGRLMIGPARRLFVTGGFCGGVTTFSALSLETFLLASRSTLAAGAYLAASIILSLAAVWAGHALATRLNR
jgi:CrcB protein